MAASEASDDRDQRWNMWKPRRKSEAMTCTRAVVMGMPYTQVSITTPRSEPASTRSHRKKSLPSQQAHGLGLC